MVKTTARCLLGTTGAPPDKGGGRNLSAASPLRSFEGFPAPSGGRRSPLLEGRESHVTPPLTTKAMLLVFVLVFESVWVSERVRVRVCVGGGMRARDNKRGWEGRGVGVGRKEGRRKGKRKREKHAEGIKKEGRGEAPPSPSPVQPGPSAVRANVG